MKKRFSLQSLLGAIALSMLMLVATVPMAGCNASTVAQDIVNWTPALQGAVATVDTTASLLMPVDAPVFAAATAGFDAASNILVGQAKAYLANPNQTVLAAMQTQIVTLQQQINAAVLQAARIVDPNSQQHALAAIQAVGTVVSAMLALIQSISSKMAIAQMTANSTIKLAQVRPYLWTDKAVRQVAQHYGEPVQVAAMQVAWGNYQLERAGF